MHPFDRALGPVALRSGVALAVAALTSCGGGDTTDPVVVASVVITAPAAAPDFQTFGRTLQFAAEARDAGGAVIPGRPIAWQSTVTGVATISGTGLLTVVGNGTTQIRASSGTVQSTAMDVDVAQYAAQTVATPGSVAFGAIGSSRQLAAAATDSGGAAVVGGGAAVWTSLGDGATASVSGTGLVTALAVGASDSAVATIGARADTVPITVTQVVAEIEVSQPNADTLATTGRTKLFTAIARDSQANLMAGAALTWSSTAPGVATVDNAGLAAAVADGTTNIRATNGAVFDQLALTVLRYAETFTLAPADATLNAPAATQLFTSTAQDSVGTTLPTSWLVRDVAVATIDNATGASTTVTAAGNGATYLVRSAGTRTDSASITASNQPTLPNTIDVNIGDLFFASVRNGTQNPAVDTLAVGGTVTWTWAGGGVITHSVTSDGSPSFTSSTVKATGTYDVMFGSVGTYAYVCSVHPQMTGTIVVRTP